MIVIAIVFFISAFAIALAPQAPGRWLPPRTLTMATKKILITGIGVDTTEQGIRSLLGHFGPVEQIEIICEGSPTEPVALVEMDLSDGQAFYLTHRITHYRHEGSILSAHLLMY